MALHMLVFLVALNFPNSISKSGEREATASSHCGYRSNYRLKCCKRNECGCFYGCSFLINDGIFTMNVFNVVLKNVTEMSRLGISPSKPLLVGFLPHGCGQFMKRYPTFFLIYVFIDFLMYLISQALTRLSSSRATTTKRSTRRPST